jgi:hypothetical protein
MHTHKFFMVINLRCSNEKGFKSFFSDNVDLLVLCYNYN